MHPAKSVIFFTTASGAGYGMLFIMSIGQVIGLFPADKIFGISSFAMAFGLITAGLLSSTFHLGHPERAWRALTQWRSSWLSREGVSAIATYVPTGIYAVIWCFSDLLSQPTTSETLSLQIIISVVGLIGGMMSLTTVFTTSMIYASLRPIPAWHNRHVPFIYLAYAIVTGLVLVSAFYSVTIGGGGLFILDVAAAVGLIFIFRLKRQYWVHIDQDRPGSTVETATGLGKFGQVKLLDAPHTQSNYLLQEMGFQIARRHADKLRRLAIFLGVLVPFLGSVLSLLLGVEANGSIFVHFMMAGAVMSGVYFERWLFFAEAKHTVNLYYGADKV